MSTAIVPYILRDDSVLTPEIVNGNFGRLLEQQVQTADRRWTLDSYVVPFKPGATEATDQAQLEFRQRGSLTHRIVGYELYVYGGDGEVFSLYDATNAETRLEVTAAGASTLAVGRVLSGGLNLSAFSSLRLQLRCSNATWTADQAWMVIHYVYDRHEGAYPTAAAVPVLSSDTMAAAKTKVNNSLTSLAALNATMAANEDRLRIEVIAWPEFGFTAIPALEQDIILPDDGGLLYYFDLVGTWDSGVTLTAEVFDDAAVSQGSRSGTGGGATSVKQVIGSALSAQMDGDGCALAHDWTMRLTMSGTTNVYSAYMVLYWSK